MFLALPVARRGQRVILHDHRYRCKKCDALLRQPIPIAEGKHRHLKSFERYVVELCELLPIKHVAALLHIGWDRVSAIYKAHLADRKRKRRLSKVEYIAVDEFDIRKGHNDMTVIMDLESGMILHAHEGKEASTAMLK